MDLSVIIVNYKTPEKTSACIDSIKNSDTGNLNLEIVVVDNKSDDNSDEIIIRNHPDIKFVKSEKNSGMGEGNNLGIRNSKGEFILISNPDILIKKDALRTLHRYMKENKEVGVVGPKFLNPDKTLQYSCRRFHKFLTPVYARTFLGYLAKDHVDNFLMKDFNHNEKKEVDWVMGSCFLTRRDIFEKYGFLFNKKFFMYFEDTELCRRLKRDNFRVVYNPEAVVVHDHERGSAGRPWYLAPFIDRLAREHIKSWIKYFLS